MTTTFRKQICEHFTFPPSHFVCGLARQDQVQLRHPPRSMLVGGPWAVEGGWSHFGRPSSPFKYNAVHQPTFTLGKRGLGKPCFSPRPRPLSTGGGERFLPLNKQCLPPSKSWAEGEGKHQLLPPLGTGAERANALGQLKGIGGILYTALSVVGLRAPQGQR